MSETLNQLWMATGTLVLGAGAGFTPGPLSALILAESVGRGWRRGAVVAIAPLVSDALVIPLCIFGVGLADRMQWGLAGLSILGGCYLLYLALVVVRTPNDVQVEAAATKSGNRFAQGIVVNVLNPHPWLFWIVFGGPQILVLSSNGAGPVILFLVSFYTGLVGAKFVLALAGARLPAFLPTKARSFGKGIFALILFIFALQSMYYGVHTMRSSMG